MFIRFLHFISFTWWFVQIASELLLVNVLGAEVVKFAILESPHIFQKEK
jgi:hypothetical protein